MLANGGTAQRQGPGTAQQPGGGQRAQQDDSARQPYNGAHAPLKHSLQSSGLVLEVCECARPLVSGFPGSSGAPCTACGFALLQDD